MKFEEIIENAITRATHPGYSNPFSGILHPKFSQTFEHSSGTQRVLLASSTQPTRTFE